MSLSVVSLDSSELTFGESDRSKNWISNIEFCSGGGLCGSSLIVGSWLVEDAGSFMVG